MIRMEDLRRIFEFLGFANVQTYIQSGNVIFESDENDADALAEQISDRMEAASGHRIKIFVRTIREVQAMANGSPFTAEVEQTVHIVFLPQKPEKMYQQALLALKSQSDDFVVKGREVYNLRRDRAKSVFSNNLIEQTLKLPATTRNRTAIKKSAEKYK